MPLGQNGPNLAGQNCSVDLGGCAVGMKVG